MISKFVFFHTLLSLKFSWHNATKNLAIFFLFLLFGNSSIEIWKRKWILSTGVIFRGEYFSRSDSWPSSSESEDDNSSAAEKFEYWGRFRRKFKRKCKLLSFTRTQFFLNLLFTYAFFWDNTFIFASWRKKQFSFKKIIPIRLWHQKNFKLVRYV